ncbi:multicopper oxidase domain-containing protein [Salsipaludibacter albus]|uniref:multicopper oxidase domain-containing protein n=1 Tax=Salsipaludibacter albus TaxID=2849650 RepID=UPI001EE44BCF|nr:multicopper oxidase domain-containing protein [Salsipaludibacter albus]
MSDHAPTDTTNRAGLAAIAVGVIACLLAVYATGVALAARDGGPAGTAAATTNAAGAAPIAAPAGGEVAVSLSEYAITPDVDVVPTGATLAVTNDGAIPHNLTVTGADLATADLGAGETGALDVSSLAAGTYEWTCTIEGHATAGMAGSFTIGDAEVAAVAATDEGAMDHGDDTAMAMPTSADMEQAMQDSIGAFPAETEGKGAQPMEPEILPDGTKLFELVVDEVEWEVEPGKVVDALAYNGQVPGPTLRADIGDTVTIRVVNELDDEATSLHPHGLRDHEFAIDGVTYISQDPIASGDAMDYTFVAEKPSVMMYHSHHMSLHQVLNGLAGSMIIGDYAELAGIDGVVDEIVMITNDAGSLGFTLNGKSFPATEPYSYTSGDKVIVHYYNEGLMAHPMHLHNQDGLVIAKDGYVLDDPWYMDTLNVAPGERYTVVYELEKPGTWVWHCHILSHVKRDDGTMFGMLTAMIVEEADAT